ncbi:hypothetical protein ASF56_24815 [Methylobacterium sp. Leaf122]|nr:hypothetical protein ASF56_24815 [Methylobacterium sp. Leaf122]
MAPVVIEGTMSVCMSHGDAMIHGPSARADHSAHTWRPRLFMIARIDTAMPQSSAFVVAGTLSENDRKNGDAAIRAPMAATKPFKARPILSSATSFTLDM